MHGFELRQVGRRDFDGVATYGQDHNELPRMQLVLVLDHLRTLPVVLNARALERELFHLDGDGATGLSFDHCNIIF